MPNKKIEEKEDWIIIKENLSMADRAKLDELFLILGVKEKEFSPSENGNNSCMVKVSGQKHVIAGLQLIFGHGFTFHE